MRDNCVWIREPGSDVLGGMRTRPNIRVLGEVSSEDRSLIIPSQMARERSNSWEG